MTRTRPRTPAKRPARSDAFPSVGDTLCTVDWVSFTGRAPVARTRARFLAAVWSPTPVMEVVPDVMPVLQATSCATAGADCTTLSSTMAISRVVPVLQASFPVNWVQALAASLLKSRLTDQAPVLGLTTAVAPLTPDPPTATGPTTYLTLSVELGPPRVSCWSLASADVETVAVAYPGSPGF